MTAPGPVELVDFVDAHTDELVRMWRQSFEHGVGIVDPHPLREQRRYFIEHVLPSQAVRVAMVDGAMVKVISSLGKS